MTEEVTGGDLYVFWRLSQVHLPRIADVFYDANRMLGGNAGTTGAFRANDAAYPGAAVMTSSIAAAWDDVRVEMQAMMEQIGTTIIDAADGLLKAAHAFDEVDRVNGSLLGRYMDDVDNHDPNDSASNAPAPYAGDNPGRPYGSL